MAKGWTSDLPTQSGFYWLRLKSRHAERDDSQDMVVQVSISSDRPFVMYVGFEEPDWLTAQCFAGYVWQGPIEPKEESGQ